MTIFAIDDERYALLNISSTVKEVLPSAELFTFNTPAQLLEELERGTLPDIAFLDIKMRGMSGLELAVRIKSCSPLTNIIFVTAYSEHAYNAITLRASGYIMKPITKEALLEELNHLRNPLTMESKNKVKARCFGNFEIYYDGVPLHFERRRTKELVAYLIDRRGASVSTGELCAILYEDEFPSVSIKTQIRALIADLKHTLERIDESDVFITSRNNFAINASAIDCDYYRMLNGDLNALNSYCGEYMVQYTWAELTVGEIESKRRLEWATSD